MSLELTPTPVIVHLSGRRRGHTQRLSGELIRIGTSADAGVRLGLKPGNEASLMATLVLRESTYEFIAEPGLDCWVNGERTERTILNSGDVLEIGRPGTILRFRLYKGGSKAYKTIGQAFSDCADCAHHGATNPLARLLIMLYGPPFELATQTPITVRVVFA
ncbi:MAG: FHA domain-containing protein, partial [Bacteroidetes bacterium]|nr:FHA domain-containing protein [Bacteroidota bacterium]